MAAALVSPAGDGLGCELTSVWLQPANVSTISWSNFATVVLRAAAATGDSRVTECVEGAVLTSSLAHQD